jgi:hypothetical protein
MAERAPAATLQADSPIPAGKRRRIYGVAEIATVLSDGEVTIDRRHVAVARRRGALPDPDEELAMGPAWLAATIEPWLAGQLNKPAGARLGGRRPGRPPQAGG